MKTLGFAGAALIALASGLPAVAADLPVKAPPPIIVVDNWTGFYVGLNGGYSWGSADTTLTLAQQTIGIITTTTLGGTVLGTQIIPAGPPTAVAFGDRARMNGWVFGGQAGYNWKVDRWVWGIEADLQGTGQRGSSLFCTTAGCPATTGFVSAESRLRWFGTLRGRVGLLADPNFLLYATGGLAVGQISNDYVLGTIGGALPLAVGSASRTRSGYTVGGGGEYRFSERWSAKLEYLFVNLGTVDAGLTGVALSPPFTITAGDFRFVGVAATGVVAAISTRFTDHILRAGINYRF